MFDTIVFTQEELTEAIQNGFCRIALCDNDFVIPEDAEIEYTLLGNAGAKGKHYSGAAELYEGYYVNGYGVNLI